MGIAKIGEVSTERNNDRVSLDVGALVGENDDLLP